MHSGEEQLVAGECAVRAADHHELTARLCCRCEHPGARLACANLEEHSDLLQFPALTHLRQEDTLLGMKCRLTIAATEHDEFANEKVLQRASIISQCDIRSYLMPIAVVERQSSVPRSNS